VRVEEQTALIDNGMEIEKIIETSAHYDPN